MREIIKNTKFRTKIIVLCMSILLINTTLAGMLYYSYATKDTLNNYYNSSEDILYQANNHLTDRVQSITKRVHALYNNSYFYKSVNNYLTHADSANYAKVLGDMADSISELIQGDRYIHSVSVYTQYSEFDNFTRTRRREFRFKESDMYRYFQDNPSETICWFPARVDPVFIGNEVVIPVVYRFKIGRQEVYFVISLQQSEVIKYLKNTYSSFEKLFIVDQYGRNVANCGPEELKIIAFLGSEDLEGQKAVCKQVVYKGIDYLGTYTQMKGTGWQIYSLRSKDSLIGNLEKLRSFIIIILIVSTMVSIMAIVILANSITKPLRQFVNIMNKTIGQEFHVQFRYPYNDEVGHLAKSFNYMVGEIDDLVTQLNINIEALKEEKENVKKVQAQKRKAELKALQAQINPHFLYNTLNAITWQAADQGATEISVLSNSLGKFFRVSLSKGKEIITFREEIEHVRSYLNIQSIRYKSKLKYEIDIQEEMLDMPIIKLVLQPLVENAIYHGIKLKKTTGFIKIYGICLIQDSGKKVLNLCIEDDGEGIGEEKLEVLNASLRLGVTNSNEGYGIYNVNERIKLYYGEEYGLILESEKGCWTKATIMIPMHVTEEE
ncbi:cache domain-containing sensor histidine kinase [Cellulosilyticum sp. I15G10I2]|uniref:cache domain-containing sensor histidine kinase n=1 Tax=Cellulosilyticum sp. I15G10I2 TaxID=1892843 RepID=UPI00085BD0A5|nr:sensor histidine kinase [Cellulosilyticum sp. I15G10I2]